MPYVVNRSRAAAWACLALLFVSSCWCGEGVNRGDLNIIPIEQEWELGNTMAAELAAQLPLTDDPAVAGFVGGIGQRLVESTESTALPWHFYVVADPSVNAFAIPGGHVYVNTGLIRAVQSTDELASVLAHEVAHVTARHSTERLTKAFGLNKLLQLLVGDSPGLLEQIVAQIAGRGTLAKFSRDDEREADALGLRYLTEAGYHPWAMTAMFRTLLEQQERSPSRLEQFFSTHPMTEERLQAVEELLEADHADEEPIDPEADPALRAVQERAAQIEGSF